MSLSLPSQLLLAVLPAEFRSYTNVLHSHYLNSGLYGAVIFEMLKEGSLQIGPEGYIEILPARLVSGSVLQRVHQHLKSGSFSDLSTLMRTMHRYCQVRSWLIDELVTKGITEKSQGRFIGLPLFKKYQLLNPQLAEQIRHNLLQCLRQQKCNILDQLILLSILKSARLLKLVFATSIHEDEASQIIESMMTQSSLSQLLGDIVDEEVRRQLENILASSSDSDIFIMMSDSIDSFSESGDSGSDGSGDSGGDGGGGGGGD